MTGDVQAHAEPGDAGPFVDGVRALGAPIGQGRTAEVYAWGEGRVVKLYRSGWPKETVDYECEVARLIDEAGLAAPRFLGRVDLAGRDGLIYERVNGPSMLRELGLHPHHIGRLARVLAALHATLHGCHGPGLRSQRQVLRQGVARAPAIGDDERQRLQTRLDRLSDDDVICHGDLHPDNVVMSRSGPIVIDWVTATRGSAAADVARSWVLLSTNALPAGIPPRSARAALLQILRRSFVRAYLREYRRLRGLTAADIGAWIPIVAASRLTEGIPGEQRLLLAMVRRAL